MKSPLEDGAWVEFAEVVSTQTLAGEFLRKGESVGVVFARNQTEGKGRFDRRWFSEKGESLTMSLVLPGYANHPAPQFVGMAVACAAAVALKCELQWPNDLVFGDRKLGGILTEILPDESGRRVPVVGIGVNLNQQSFPDEISGRATSLKMYRGGEYDARQVAQSILDCLAKVPEPMGWPDIQPLWMLFDQTPGKAYRLPDGREAIAMGISPQGCLACTAGDENTSVLAAEAIFGPEQAS